MHKRHTKVALFPWGYFDCQVGKQILSLTTFHSNPINCDLASKYDGRLISSAETVENIKSVPIGTIPSTASQIRPLLKLKDNPEQQREAWQQAVATAPDGKITASLVNEIVKGMTEGVEKLRPAPRQKITLYAIEFAGTVINQLEMIAANDPKREEGLRIVERWIQKNTAGREPKKLRRLGKGRITRYKLVGDSLINQTCLELIASRE